MATAGGIIKKTALSEYNSRNNGIGAIKLDDDDTLIAVMLTDGDSDLMLSTEQGLVIRFSETDVRPMGRVTRGLKGISLNDNDHVVALTKVEENSHLLVVSEKGFGKRTALTTENYRRITRGGKGVHTLRCNDKTGRLITAMNVKNDDELMLITKGGIIIRINSSDISEQGRMTQGVTLINLEPEDQVMDVARVMTRQDKNDKGDTAEQPAEKKAAQPTLSLKSDVDDAVAMTQQMSLLLERAEADAAERNNE